MEETLERRFVRAGLDAARQMGGDALVRALVAGNPGLADASSAGRVPLDEYLRYRDAAIDILQDSFCTTAFEAGRLLARSLVRENQAHLQALSAPFERAASKLPLIGQAAVLGAQGNPGVVRATMRDPELLIITIENCPECRGLKREWPFCYLNQGLIAEFAQGYLNLRVRTEETNCSALGDRVCEIQVSLSR